MKEFEIYQNPSDLPRRSFADGQNFDLTVWYEKADFKKIVGFQLGYKPNPLNTDNEYVISHFPDTAESVPLSLGKIGGQDRKYPSSKLINQTSELPPSSFFIKVQDELMDLPNDIQSYIQEYIKRIV